MHQSHPARELVLARRSISPLAVTLAALVLAVACNDNDTVHRNGSSGDGGMSDVAAGRGGASGAGTAGAPSSTAGSNATTSNGGSNDVASSGGMGGIAGAGSNGIAGTGGSAQISNCVAGGALFAVGNYADPTGNQFILSSAPKAATFALVPAGVADPAKPPQLFLVNRVCAAGGALIASDASSNYRVDFSQTGDRLALCLSAPVATLAAALLLPAADASHAASTGCAGQPFTVYTAGAP